MYASLRGGVGGNCERRRVGVLDPDRLLGVGQESRGVSGRDANCVDTGFTPDVLPGEVPLGDTIGEINLDYEVITVWVRSIYRPSHRDACDSLDREF